METCPVCGTPRPPYFTGKIYFNYIPDDEQQTKEEFADRELIFQIGQLYVISTSSVGMASLDQDRPLIRIQIISKDRLVATNISDTSCWATSASGRQTRITDRDVELTTHAELHFGEVNTPHRSLRFEEGESLRR